MHELSDISEAFGYDSKNDETDAAPKPQFSRDQARMKPRSRKDLIFVRNLRPFPVGIAVDTTLNFRTVVAAACQGASRMRGG